MLRLQRLPDRCLDHVEEPFSGATDVKPAMFSQMVSNHTGDLVQRQAYPLLGGGPQPEWRAQIESAVDVTAPRDDLCDLRLPLGDARIAVVAGVAVGHHASRLP